MRGYEFYNKDQAQAPHCIDKIGVIGRKRSWNLKYHKDIAKKYIAKKRLVQL